MQANSILLFYVTPLFVIWAVYLAMRWRSERLSLARLEDANASGLSEPMSLHPSIDPSRCLGCGACVAACPEGRILGLVRGKAILVEPSDCIGHGACKAACPHGAISLVFGSKTRGVDLPEVGPDFQTNVPGLYIAGELGGMGLIRNAVEQGRQAIESISSERRRGHPELLDVVIVGSGPAGMSASLAALERGLRCVTLEQSTLGGTVAHFPKGKLVMTQPALLPMYGKVKFREIRKEQLLEFWADVIDETGVHINYDERVESVVHTAYGFHVSSTRADYHTRTVLLAIGRRGTPRKLDVPGEEQPKVVYSLVDAEQYRSQHVLVVGGGDSALEAAGSIAEQPGTMVALSYRGAAFTRAKARNRERVARQQRAGRLKVMLGSTVVRIDAHSVDLVSNGMQLTLRNDGVVVCAGGILPDQFLKTIGVEVRTHYGST